MLRARHLHSRAQSLLPFPTMRKDIRMRCELVLHEFFESFEFDDCMNLSPTLQLTTSVVPNARSILFLPIESCITTSLNQSAFIRKQRSVVFNTYKQS